MSTPVNTYQNVLTSYKIFSTLPESAPEARKAQKALFSAISDLYPTLGLAPVEALSKDVFYWQAKLICQRETFQNYPGSLNRLTPFATDYCLSFQQLTSSLQNPPQQPETLKGKLEQLGDRHLRFVRAFTPEYMKAAPETSSVIHLKYPQSHTLLLDVVFPHIQELKTEIEDSDQEFLILKLPCLAIEKLLSSPTDLPELFQPYRSTLIKKSHAWADLSAAEKDNLHRKILGETRELAPFTEQLYHSIRSLAHAIHADERQRKEFTLVSREIYKELQIAFSILDTLPQERTEPAKALIQALLSNREIGIPDALFNEKYRLPLKAIRENGATPQEIDQLATKIAVEPKAAPWLKMILNHYPL